MARNAERVLFLPGSLVGQPPRDGARAGMAVAEFGREGVRDTGGAARAAGVAFDQETSESATVVEMRAADAVGRCSASSAR